MQAVLNRPPVSKGKHEAKRKNHLPEALLLADSTLAKPLPRGQVRSDAQRARTEATTSVVYVLLQTERPIPYALGHPSSAPQGSPPPKGLGATTFLYLSLPPLFIIQIFLLL